MSLSSTELNYLVWRYLQESGYDVAAFAFDKQSLCLKYEENKNLEILSKIEPGFLVNLVQKGILYSLTEEDIRNENKSEALSLFGALLKNERDIELSKKLKFEDSIDDSSMDIDNENSTNNNNNNNNGTNKNKNMNGNVKVEIKHLLPSINYNECLLSKWSPTSEILAYVDNDSLLSIGSVNNNELIDKKTLRTTGINSSFTTFSWSPLGNIIITSSITGDLCLWSSNGDLRNMTKGVLKNEDSSTLSYIIEIIWSISGQFFISCDSNGRICVWDSATLNLIQEINQSTKDDWSICWLDNFKFSISIKPNSIIIYQINETNNNNIKPIATLNGHEGIISNLKFNEDSKYLSSYSETDGIIKLWLSSVTSKPIELKLDDNNDNNYSKIPPIVSMDWFNNGLNLITVSIEGSIIIWDIKQKSISYQLSIFNEGEIRGETKSSFVYSSILSPNEKWLAIGDDLGKVTIWDIRSRPICKAIFNEYEEKLINSENGLCDISWDKNSKVLSVAYKGVSSVILDLDLE